MLLLLFLFLYSLMPAAEWDGDGEHTDTQVMGSLATGYLSYGCSFLFVCLVIFLRKQISLANGIVKVPRHRQKFTHPTHYIHPTGAG